MAKKKVVTRRQRRVKSVVRAHNERERRLARERAVRPVMPSEADRTELTVAPRTLSPTASRRLPKSHGTCPVCRDEFSLHGVSYGMVGDPSRPVCSQECFEKARKMSSLALSVSRSRDGVASDGEDADPSYGAAFEAGRDAARRRFDTSRCATCQKPMFAARGAYLDDAGMARPTCSLSCAEIGAGNVLSCSKCGYGIEHDTNLRYWKNGTLYRVCTRDSCRTFAQASTPERDADEPLPWSRSEDACDVCMAAIPDRTRPFKTFEGRRYACSEACLARGRTRERSKRLFNARARFDRAVHAVCQSLDSCSRDQQLRSLYALAGTDLYNAYRKFLIESQA